MKIHLVPVAAAKPQHHYFKRLADSLDAENAENVIIRWGFAYASLGGVQQLLSTVGSKESWMHVKKEFLIGIHHAISEPSALETLRKIPQAQVRAFVPGRRLTNAVFDQPPVFHPKVLAVSTIDGGDVRLLQAGSANMTLSAIGSQPKNYEFSLALQAEDSESIDPNEYFDAWWSTVWNKSREVDRNFIRQYAKLRRDIFEHNPILRSAAETPKSIAEAEYFFIEVGAGSGPPETRHQVEFSESLVQFFGEPLWGRQDLTLRRSGRVWYERPLTHKLTTYDVDIWRLGMPTQASGGIPISFRAIQFKRTSDPIVFEFKVADLDSDEYREWVSLANLNGHLGSTRGQRARQYGFYGIT